MAPRPRTGKPQPTKTNSESEDEAHEVNNNSVLKTAENIVIMVHSSEACFWNGWSGIFPFANHLVLTLEQKASRSQACCYRERASAKMQRA